MLRSPWFQEAQMTSLQKRRILLRYGDYSIFLLGLAPVYLSNQHSLSFVILFLISVPPLGQSMSLPPFLPLSILLLNPPHNTELICRTARAASKPVCSMTWVHSLCLTTYLRVRSINEGLHDHCLTAQGSAEYS